MRVETIGNATLYLGDCREVLPTLGGVDAVVTDPPYGMKWDGNVSMGKNGHGKRGARSSRSSIIGDDSPFDPSPWLAFDHCILWGANHFSSRLPIGSTLVWIKRLVAGFGSFLSDAEVAWLNRGHGVYCQQDTSLLADAHLRCHPAQKPVAIMEWCLGFVPDANTILDPYMGSGTTGLACARLGKRFIGIEIDPAHYETALRRIEAAQRQGDLLRDIPPAADPADARVADLFAPPEAA